MKFLLWLCTILSVSNAFAQTAPSGDDLTARLGAFADAARSRDSAAIRKAESELRDHLAAQRPTQEQKQEVLDLATQFPQPFEDRWDDPARTLVGALERFTIAEDVPMLVAAFPKLNTHAKAAILACLTNLKASTGAKPFLDLALKAASERQLQSLPLGDYERSDAALAVLLPDLFDLLALDNEAAFAVYGLALRLLEDSRLKSSTRDRLFITTSDAIGRMCAEFETVDAQHADTRRRSELVFLLGIALDVTSFAASERVEAIARPALALRHPSIKLWAAYALLKNNLEVADAEVLAVSNSLEHRSKLFRSLATLNRLDRFPVIHRSNHDLAIAQMVEWLVFPTELGEAPDQIELARRVEVPTDKGAFEHFIFRFLPRKTYDTNPKWLIGVCGPYRAGEFDINADATAYSGFQEWTERGIDEAAQQLIRDNAERNP